MSDFNQLFLSGGEVFNEHGASFCMLRTTETASTSTSITIAFDTNGLLLKSDLAALFVVGKYPLLGWKASLHIDNDMVTWSV